MKKNKVIYFSMLLLFFIVIASLYFPFNDENSNKSLTSEKYNYEYFSANYRSGDLKNIEDKVEIIMKKPEISFNQTTSTQETDTDFCSLMYGVRIKNIMNRPIEIYAQYIVPKELSETLNFSSSQFGLTDNNSISLLPDKGYSADADFIMKHFDNLNETELSIFNDYYQDLCIILLIDKTEYFIKMEDLKIQS